MSSTVQRKRRSSGSPLVSRPRAKTRAGANARRMDARRRSCDSRGSDVDPVPPPETIHVMDNVEDSVDEVVDLTCEASETVVDLTTNDSVLVNALPQNSRVSAGESYVVSSDEDEDSPPHLRAATLSSLQTNNTARWTPGTISCPVCMDSYTEIVDSGRLVVSTKCGHVFCSQCLRDALRRSHTCPTCRKRLTPRQYHPLYI
ncbi:E3 ubiquitin-protein ligase RNF4 [Aulostomus maculatus]